MVSASVPGSWVSEECECLKLGDVKTEFRSRGVSECRSVGEVERWRGGVVPVSHAPPAPKLQAPLPFYDAINNFSETFSFFLVGFGPTLIIHNFQHVSKLLKTPVELPA
jgi:hypothetical protein